MRMIETLDRAELEEVDGGLGPLLPAVIAGGVGLMILSAYLVGNS